ncbi:MAG: hypothetical protein JST69_12295 [Bacteroidetes bacterium]|nr:hypothetical protein [Bacteroidota bacterium]
MYQLNDTQISEIHDRLMSNVVLNNGIEPEILDHVCVIIEEKFDQGETSFNEAFEQALFIVCPNGIGEFEIEKSFLLNHKNLNMKKALFFSTYLSVTSLSLGFLCKTFHWHGGTTFMLAGFCLLILSTLFWFTGSMSRFAQKPLSEMVQILTGTPAGFMTATGCAFKLMYWPYADMLMLFGFVIFIVLFLPVFFYKQYEKAVAE